MPVNAVKGIVAVPVFLATEVRRLGDVAVAVQQLCVREGAAAGVGRGQHGVAQHSVIGFAPGIAPWVRYCRLLPIIVQRVLRDDVVSARGRDLLLDFLECAGAHVVVIVGSRKEVL